MIASPTCTVFVLRHAPGTGVNTESQSDCRSLKESVSEEPPDCAYIVTHTLPGRSTIRLQRHIQRLCESARRLEYRIVWSPGEIRSAVRYCLNALELDTARFRVTALRDGRMRISVEPYHGLPEALLLRGVECRTERESARADPSTKSTRWMLQRASMHADDVYEILLCDPAGHILEGSSSNFFAVNKGAGDQQSAIVRTAGTGVLEGVARGIVLEVCTKVAALSFEPVHLDELEQVTEAFMTSATRGVVPIRRIDGQTFHAPGPITAEISRRYGRWIDENSEPL